MVGFRTRHLGGGGLQMHVNVGKARRNCSGALGSFVI